MKFEEKAAFKAFVIIDISQLCYLAGTITDNARRINILRTLLTRLKQARMQKAMEINTGQRSLTREGRLGSTQVVYQRHLFAAQQLLDVNQNQHAVAQSTQTGQVLGGHCHRKLW